MARLLAVDVLDKVTCDGGVRLARVPDILALSTTQAVDGDEPAQLRCLRNSRAYPYLVQGRILRVVYTDGTFREFVLGRIEDASGRDSGAVDVSCVPLRTLVADCGLLADVGSGGIVDFNLGEVGLTPTEYLTDEVVARLPSLGVNWVDVGDVDPVEPLDLGYPQTTPWGLVEMVRDRTHTESRLRRDGTAQYLIDLLDEIGSTEPLTRLRTGKNLIATQRSRDRSEQTTTSVVFGTEIDGAAATIAESEWLVTVVNGGTKRLTLADPNGGADPIAFDGQLDGLYAVKDAATFGEEVILNTYSASQEIRLGSVAGYTAGDLIQLRVTSGSNGQQMTELGSGAYGTTYGRKVTVLNRSDIPGYRNAVRNGLLSVWTGASSAAPNGWTKYDPDGACTLARVAAPHWGTYGCTVSFATLPSFPSGGIYRNAIVRPRSGAALFTFSAYVVAGANGLPSIASGGDLQLRITDTTGATILGQVQGCEAVGGTAVGAILDLSITIDLTGYTEVRVFVGSMAAVMYNYPYTVDAVQATQTATVQPYAEFSQANQLWQAGNVLLLSAVEPVEYHIEIADLERLDGESFADDELRLGGQVIIHDTDLGITPTGRLLRIEVDELRPAKTQITIGVVPKFFTRRLAA